MLVSLPRYCFLRAAILHIIKLYMHSFYRGARASVAYRTPDVYRYCNIIIFVCYLIELLLRVVARRIIHIVYNIIIQTNASSAGRRLENECNACRYFFYYYCTCGRRIKKSNQVGGEIRVAIRGGVGKPAT